MIKLYGPPQSSAARSFWTAEEAGAPYEQVAVSMRQGEHKSADFLKLNPNGKVPVLTDGDFVLWESTAINTYLAESYKPALLGTDAQSRGLVAQWSVWSQVDLQPPTVAWFIQQVFVPEERRQQSVMDDARTKIVPLVELLDRHLDGREFMVGDTFTLADLNIASVVRILAIVQMDISHLTHLSAWIGRMLARPAAQRASALS